MDLVVFDSIAISASCIKYVEKTNETYCTLYFTDDTKKYVFMPFDEVVKRIKDETANRGLDRLDRLEKYAMATFDKVNVLAEMYDRLKK